MYTTKDAAIDLQDQIDNALHTMNKEKLHKVLHLLDPEEAEQLKAVARTWGQDEDKEFDEFRDNEI